MPWTQPQLNLLRDWHPDLGQELQSPRFYQLRAFLREEVAEHAVYPPFSQTFRAYELCPFEQTRVVIVGQDPYHGPGQGEGLSFSVADGVKHPPSLRNIFKELETDLGHPAPASGSLVPWARQGVLLLNAVLSVRHKQANSHRKRGWEELTDKTLQLLGKRDAPLVFILWGGPAQKKAKFVEGAGHGVIKTPHPSPLSAYRGFFGSRPFSRCNELLQGFGLSPIDWRLGD